MSLAELMKLNVNKVKSRVPELIEKRFMYTAPKILNNAELDWFQKSGLPVKLLETTERIRDEQRWYLNGKLHRDGAPALISPSLEVWYQHGERHRDNDLPAWTSFNPVTRKKQMEDWYKNGQLHRDNDLPARIYYDESGTVRKKEWFQHNQLFRPSGLPNTVLYNTMGAPITGFTAADVFPILAEPSQPPPQRQERRAPEPSPQPLPTPQQQQQLPAASSEEEEEPEPLQLPPPVKDRRCKFPGCTVTGDPPGSTLKCQRCKTHYYCSKEHQTAHWKEGGHKQACVRIAEEN